MNIRQITNEEKNFLSEIDQEISKGHLNNKPLLKNQLSISVLKLNNNPFTIHDTSCLEIIEKHLLLNLMEDGPLSEIRSNISNFIHGKTYDSPESYYGRLLLMASSPPGDANIDDIEYIIEWARGIGVEAHSVRKIFIDLIKL